MRVIVRDIAFVFAFFLRSRPLYNVFTLSLSVSSLHAQFPRIAVQRSALPQIDPCMSLDNSHGQRYIYILRSTLGGTKFFSLHVVERTKTAIFFFFAFENSGHSFLLRWCAWEFLFGFALLSCTSCSRLLPLIALTCLSVDTFVSTSRISETLPDDK